MPKGFTEFDYLPYHSNHATVSTTVEAFKAGTLKRAHREPSQLAVAVIVQGNQRVPPANDVVRRIFHHHLADRAVQSHALRIAGRCGPNVNLVRPVRPWPR